MYIISICYIPEVNGKANAPHKGRKGALSMYGSNALLFRCTESQAVDTNDAKRSIYDGTPLNNCVTPDSDALNVNRQKHHLVIDALL